MSIHRADVFTIKLETHPNADKLEITRFLGFSCCVLKDQFKDGDLAVYIQPDSLVDTTRPEFAFLGDKKRIKVKKLRGVISQGLVVAAPEGLVEGDDAAEAMNITHYEPELSLSNGPNKIRIRGPQAKAPEGYHPEYDLERLERFQHLFARQELIVATEKLDGVNSRYCYIDGIMHCGSHRTWKLQDDNCLWWKALAQNPWLESFCRNHEDLTVYAEVYGPVQKLRYGKGDGQYGIAVFDLLRGTEWLSFDELVKFKEEGLQLVPVIYHGEFDIPKLRELAEGYSVIEGARNIREGLVVKPLIERTDIRLGRVQVKIISNAYYEIK